MSQASFTLAELKAQEEELQFTHFDNDDAWALGKALVDVARARNAPVAIQIARNSHVLFKVALPGASPDNDAWIARKSRVVERFGHSSLYVRMQCEAEGTTLEGTFALDPREYAAHGGAFPIVVRDVGPVGVVVVSGLPQIVDHQLVIDVLRAHLAQS
jgi:uncharacterized protein (UPF0303 family)